MKEQLIFYGIRPTMELIESGKEIDTIYLQKDSNSSWATEIKKKTSQYNINLKLVPKYKLNRLTNKNHQGVVALASHVIFQDFENLLALTFSKGEFPLFLLLDRITDVRNFGAISRTAECSGVDAILIPEKNAAAINSDAIKTSAGALHKIIICRTWNIKLTLQFIKESGIQIIACSEKANKNMYNPNYKLPTAIIIGSEEDGISEELLKICDKKVKIPMKGEIASLNASVASGVILYEILKQRGDV